MVEELFLQGKERSVVVRFLNCGKRTQQPLCLLRLDCAISSLAVVCFPQEVLQGAGITPGFSFEVLDKKRNENKTDVCASFVGYEGR